MGVTKSAGILRRSAQAPGLGLKITRTPGASPWACTAGPTASTTPAPSPPGTRPPGGSGMLNRPRTTHHGRSFPPRPGFLSISLAGKKLQLDLRLVATCGSRSHQRQREILGEWGGGRPPFSPPRRLLRGVVVRGLHVPFTGCFEEIRRGGPLGSALGCRLMLVGLFQRVR